VEDNQLELADGGQADWFPEVIAQFHSVLALGQSEEVPRDYAPGVPDPTDASRRQKRSDGGEQGLMAVGLVKDVRGKDQIELSRRWLTPIEHQGAGVGEAVSSSIFQGQSKGGRLVVRKRDS
jgi:hypothetical protein